MINWEGAEICYYLNGESYSIGLSDVQFAIVAKILGLELNQDGSITCFSDESLRQFASMKSNPLKFQGVKKERF